MAEYIDKSQLKRSIKRYFKHCIDKGKYKIDVLDANADIHKIISELPAIERLPDTDVVQVVKKPIKEYEGYYEVDNFGRVFSVDRVLSVNDNGRLYKKHLKGKPMKQFIHSAGYKIVPLTKQGKTTNYFVHRLVAEAFIENPKNLPMVNHKDEDKTNNFVENLEWCTNEYNLSYGNARKRQANSLKGKKHTAEHNAKISASLKKHYKNKCENHFCSYGERKDNENL